MPPPESLRYCAMCKQIMVFKYQKNLGHSSCSSCHWRYIPTVYSQEQRERFKQESKEAWAKFDSQRSLSHFALLEKGLKEYRNRDMDD